MGFFSKKAPKELIIYSPVDGKIKDLKDVKDEVFSGKMIGDGIAVVPTSKDVMSPLETGKIVTAFPTGHAVGIETLNKVGILVHIGVDTVTLNGKGFDLKVSIDQAINKNTLLSSIDLKIIEKEAVASDIMILATNETMEGKKIEYIKTEGDVKVGDALYKIVKK